MVVEGIGSTPALFIDPPVSSKEPKKPNKTIFTYATFSLEDEYDECPLSLGNDTITSSNKRLSLISNKGLFWPSVHYQSKTEETQKDNFVQEV